MRNCGSCSLCCKLIEAPGLAPIGKWCPHAKPGNGCSIHQERPNFCKTYECLWKLSDVLDKDLRPDNCGVIFEVYRDEKIVIANADLNRKPTKKVSQLIEQMIRDGYSVWFMQGKNRHLFLAEHATELIIRSETEKLWRKHDRSKLY